MLAEVTVNIDACDFDETRSKAQFRGIQPWYRDFGTEQTRKDTLESCKAYCDWIEVCVLGIVTGKPKLPR